MATSLLTTFNLTRDQIIRASYEDLGVAVAGEELEPEQIQVAQIAFNSLAKRYSMQGMHLWKRGRYSLTTVDGTASYTIAPTLGTGTEKAMRILHCSRKNSDDAEVELTNYSLQEYDNLSDKTTTGTPTIYYYEPTRTSGTLYLWPVPDATFAANDTIEIIYEQAIQDMDVGNEDIDFPSEWYDALTLNLAYRLSGKYGTLDYRERRLLRDDAERALEEAKEWDTEDSSIYFQPDFD